MSISTFIPKIWTARLLEYLDKAHVAVNFFNRSYEGDITDQGDTVKINRIGAINIIPYVRNTDLPAPEELSMVAQELTLDKGDAFNFQIDDVDAVQARAELMDAAMERSAYSLADKLDKYLFEILADGAANANIIGTASQPYTVDSAEKAFDLLLRLRLILAKNNVPTMNRRLAIPPEMVGYLLNDARFTGGGAFAQDALKNGLIGRALGFDVFEVNNLPQTGGAVSILASHEIAATYANQILKTEAFRMEKRFADGLKGLSVYGAKVIAPEAVAKAFVVFE